MSTLDIILLVCFVPAIVRGIQRGFIAQVVSLVSVILGIWLAFHFSEMACEWLKQYLPNLSETVLNIAGFVLILVVVALLLHLVGALLTKTLQTLSLGFVNRLLGLVFGVLKVALILGLLILLFETLNSSLGIVKPETTANAVVYNALKNAANAIFPILKSFVTGGGADPAVVDAAAAAAANV